MKPLGCWRGRRGSLYLPGQLAGASLKRRRSRSCRRARQYLPGQLAGASLKRLTDMPKLGLLSVSPRPIGRGLIEAFSRRASSAPMSDLPGQLAGASLKPFDHFLLTLVGGNLPGQLAGASLKHRRQMHHCELHRRSPRPIGRGLIEAIIPENQVNDSSGISPANWPGPH